MGGRKENTLSAASFKLYALVGLFLFCASTFFFFIYIEGVGAKRVACSCMSCLETNAQWMLQNKHDEK